MTILRCDTCFYEMEVKACANTPRPCPRNFCIGWMHELKIMAIGFDGCV